MASNSGVTYTVEFVNNSTNAGSMMIFQKAPNVAQDGVMSLAWFSKYLYPTTKGEFDWQIDYNFVWSQTGVLKPGVHFTASQAPVANLTSLNAVTLEFDAVNNAYFFSPVTQSAGAAGSLYITENGTVPLDQASVGIGMSGSGTFAVQAQPNMNVTFTPHPEYWVAFGNYTTGEVLDIQAINNDAAIEFPPGIYTMTATLNADNSWTITPGSNPA